MVEALDNIMVLSVGELVSLNEPLEVVKC